MIKPLNIYMYNINEAESCRTCKKHSAPRREPCHVLQKGSSCTSRQKLSREKNVLSRSSGIAKNSTDAGSLARVKRQTPHVCFY